MLSDSMLPNGDGPAVPVPQLGALLGMNGTENTSYGIGLQPRAEFW